MFLGLKMHSINVHCFSFCGILHFTNSLHHLWIAVSYSATTGEAIYLLRSACLLVKHVELIDPQLLKLRSARLLGLPLLLNRKYELFFPRHTRRDACTHTRKHTACYGRPHQLVSRLNLFWSKIFSHPQSR